MPTPEIPLTMNIPVRIKMPRVFRYMDAQYIDQFFDTGALRLGSFARFRGYPDEVRGDPSEGQGIVVTKGGNNGIYNMVTSLGHDAYVFCTSLESSPRIREQFGNQSSFVINDPLAFAMTVARSVPGITGAILGFCNYQEQRVIEKVNASLTGNEMFSADGAFQLSAATLGAVYSKTVGTGLDLLFLKHMNYQSQAEFRFIWTVASQFNTVTEFLDISCREAVQFCARVEGDRAA